MNLNGYKIAAPVAGVVDADVDEALDHIRDAGATRVPTFGLIEIGDSVEITYDATVDGGVGVARTAFQINGDSLGLQFVGKKPGDRFFVSTNNQSVEVHIVSSMRLSRPQLSDAMAQKYGYDTLVNMREAVQARLSAQGSRSADAALWTIIRDIWMSENPSQNPNAAATAIALENGVDLFLSVSPEGVRERRVQAAIVEYARSNSEIVATPKTLKELGFDPNPVRAALARDRRSFLQSANE